MRPLRPDYLAVLDAIEAAAETGRKCPSNNALCDVIGCASASRPAEIIHKLERRGLIRVERFAAGRRVTIVSTGKATVHKGSTAPHWRAAVTQPANARIAPPSLCPAPPILTPRAADMFIQLADQLGGANATDAQEGAENQTRALTLREVVDMEAAEAGRRRAHARSNESMTAPFPVLRPMPVLTAPERQNDRRPFASGREPYRRCQTRGDLGCAHQRPFVAEARP